MSGFVWWSTDVLGRSRVSESKSRGKPFEISKRVVWEAYLRVKANKGVAGVDGVSIAEFERDRDKNLYRVWSASSRTGGEAMRWCS